MFAVLKRFVIIVSCTLPATQGRVGFGPNEQDWGYVTVREKAHMFWWLHYTTATGDYVQRPLVIWLQGGPGGSSTGIGNFQEIGPWDEAQNIRNYSWINYLNVLFVDNPVGTGYSFVEDVNDSSLFAGDNEAISNDFLVLLKGFFTQKPEFEAVPLYIYGQSYGKMTVDIALKLHQEFMAARINCNFKGIGLGDAWVSPISSLTSWPPYLLNLGFIDPENYELLKIVTDVAETEIDKNEFQLASAYFQATQVVINGMTSVNYYNVLKPVEAKNVKQNQNSWLRNTTMAGQIIRDILHIEINDVNLQDDLTREDVDGNLSELMNGPVRKSLELKDIPIQWGEQSEAVFQAVKMDFMKPVTESVERLLNETALEVTVYNGQLDLIASTPGTISWINKLQWSGADGYKQSARLPIIVNGVNEGYYKSYKNFRFFWINRAGQAVPTDNPHTMDHILRATVDVT
ncbi:hypothetical protein HUJ04_010369 [Dendroctonus ponderosae]|nr:hypothetical protein HUJ04_010369 [Dendroctonus ponderosae]KAH1020759.1 hypothetical protein HUJ04_010369 [Dendroctonus ponderosae]